MVHAVTNAPFNIYARGAYTLIDIAAAVLAVGAAVFVVLSGAALDEKLIVGFMAVSLAARLDSRFSLGLSLVSLACIPVFYSLGNEPLAEDFTRYVFYFLGSGIISASLERQVDRDFREAKPKPAPAMPAAPAIRVARRRVRQVPPVQLNPPPRPVPQPGIAPVQLPAPRQPAATKTRLRPAVVAHVQPQPRIVPKAAPFTPVITKVQAGPSGEVLHLLSTNLKGRHPVPRDPQVKRV